MTRRGLVTLLVVLLVTAGLLTVAIVATPEGRVCRVVVATRNALTQEDIRQLEAKDPRLASCRWFIPKQVKVPRRR